jgi:hypothetical protein
MCYSDKPGEKNKMLPCSGTCRKEDRCKTALEQMPALAGSKTEYSSASSRDTLFDIEHSTLFSVIQRRFTEIYPYLRLDFRSSNTQHIGHAIPGDPGNSSSLLDLNMPGDMTVADLVNEFRAYGLTVIVSRRSGNAWVETLLTDDWTLSHQNQEAMLVGQLTA